ncbi:MAG: RDD family protein [Burkholderiaceae bacterium]|nr:RDD family protein [Burkholderiaceae bacterium]
MQPAEVEYAGFWIRVGAALIDTLLLAAITLPLLVSIYGWAYFGEETTFFAGPADFLISWILPAMAVIAFWLTRQATPGKMLLALRVVDATTGNTLSVGQSLGRYLGYYVSTIPLLIGLIWVAFDSKKQGWHDKLAGTVVVRARSRGSEPVKFEPRG